MMTAPVAWVLNLDAEVELARAGPHQPTQAMVARTRALRPALEALLGADLILWPAEGGAPEPPAALSKRTERATSRPWARRPAASGAVPPEAPGAAAPAPEVQRPPARAGRGAGQVAGASLASGPQSSGAPAPWGRAWALTAWARRTLLAGGARLPQAPALSVLARVFHRRFALELGPGLPGTRFVTDEGALARALADRAALEESSCQRRWLMRRPFGFAGRGRLLLHPGEAGERERRWIVASWPAGLLLEPWVEVEAEFALHGYLAPEGACTMGQVTCQRVDAHGAWQGSVLAGRDDLDARERALLWARAERAAALLSAAGYFGPFGLDAYRWRDPAGRLRFQPTSELNPRYSMGWALGMGGFRPPPGWP